MTAVKSQRGFLSGDRMAGSAAVPGLTRLFDFVSEDLLRGGEVGLVLLIIENVG